MQSQFEKDKKYLLEWLSKNAHGYKNARVSDDILSHLLGSWNKRYFQRVISELKHENHISSTSSLGIWFNPLWSNDYDEVKAQLQSAEEVKRRALTSIEGADKVIRACKDKMAGMTYQPALL